VNCFRYRRLAWALRVLLADHFGRRYRFIWCVPPPESARGQIDPLLEGLEEPDDE
jgi:hypothetical protein